MQRKVKSFILLVRMQTGAATLENSMEALQEVKMELLYNPAIVLLGIYQEDTKILIQRDTCTQMFIEALSTKTKLQKEPNVHQLMNG